jgi:mandelate racemase
MTLPTIARITLRAADVPLDPPVETGAGIVARAPLVLVDLATSDGAQGRAYIFTYTPAALAPTAKLTENLASLLIGKPLAPLDLNAGLQARLRLLGNQGLVAMAVAALDMAAWDAASRRADLSLAAHLGAAPAPIPAYASLRSMDIGKLAREAEHAAKLGFKAAKLKTGRADPQADREALLAVRAILGPQATLMIDYNQCLDEHGAVARARGLEDLDLGWIEEPLPATDFAGHACVAAAIRQPVQIGENWWGPEDAAKSLQARASVYAMPDAMKIGGVTGWLKTAALCEAAGLRVSSHLFCEISAHLLAATPTRHYLEWLDLAAPILREPVRVIDGAVAPLPGPGIGLVWDETALAKYLV